MSVHQTDNGEEMEALAVRQKRPRTPSPHSSGSSNHEEHVKETSDNTPPDKSKDKINQSSGKSALPRPLKREKVLNKKRVTKSK